MKNKELVNKVRNWARERGLDKSDPRAQYMKIVEELRELVVSGMLEEQGEVIDAVGDMQVTLIVYCLIRGIEYPDTDYEYNFGDDAKDFDENKLKDTLLDLTAGVGLISEGYNKQKDNKEQLGLRRALFCLDVVSELFGVRKKFCLEEAYEVIAKRKGKMVNGVFVKNEDLK